MDISIFIARLLVLVCSVGGIVAVMYGFKLIVQGIHTSDTKWSDFCLLGILVCVVMLLLALIYGSIIAISERQGFYSYGQDMCLLPYHPYYGAIWIVAMVLCGIWLFSQVYRIFFTD